MLDSVVAKLCRMRKSFRAVLPHAGVLALLCASLTTFASTSLAQQGTFITTGSQNTARYQHTATLLNNGKVLVAGGVDANDNPLSSAELFDPSTGTFTATGSMNTTRTEHTATLLQNGNVLIAGGAGGTTNTFLTSAELYDPTTGIFTPTGSLNTARSQYTGTLLKNGKVLMAGGVNVTGQLANSEVYDPATGTFTLTGSLTTARYSHTATLLNNGMVLIAGGFINNVGDTASAELFDPSTGTFTSTGNLNTGRFVHTATLLNNGTVLITGGVGGTTILAGAELYDPTTRTFTPTGSLNTARAGPTASLLNSGMVLIAGGQGVNAPNSLSSAELYNSTIGTFTFTGSLNTGRQTHTATLLNNGTVLMAGGQGTNSPGALASAELYVLVAVSPMSVSFSNQTVGASVSQTAVLTNNKSTALTITAIAVSGTNASDFSESDNCVGSVPTGASCSINVVFTPGALGSRTGSLNIAINASGVPGASLTVPLTGIGATAAQVSVTPSSITFPAQYVGTSGLPQSVTVMNNGGTSLNIASVTTSATDFGTLNTCGSTVAAGSTCTIGVFFDPTAGGTRTGTLTITDNAGNSPQTITLTGSGQDFSMTPGSASTATVAAGQTANYSIAVAPAGGFAQSVALSCSGGPAGSTCAVSPNTIALSGAAAQMAMVTVTTAAHGWLLPFEGGWPKDTRYRQTPMILILAGMLFLLMVIASLFGRREQNLAWVRVAVFAALVTLGLTLTSCGGGSASSGGGTNPQAGTYTINVTGNFTTGSTTLTHAAKLTLVVQ